MLTAAGLVAGGASAALVRHLRGAADQPTPSRVDGTYEAVHSTVEATLFFPGSAESQDVGDSSDGQSAAWAGGIYTTDGSSEDVRAWFKNKLEGLGWHSWDGAVRITTMVSVDGYERGNKERYVWPSMIVRSLSGSWDDVGLQGGRCMRPRSTCFRRPRPSTTSPQVPVWFD